MPYALEHLSDPTSVDGWEKRLEVLQKDFPDCWEDIVCAKLAILEYKNPNQADYYKSLSQDLADRINQAWSNDPDDFGFEDAQILTRNFIAEHGLSDLVKEIDMYPVFDIGEEEEERGTWGDYFSPQLWSDDSLDAYLGPYRHE